MSMILKKYFGYIMVSLFFVFFLLGGNAFAETSSNVDELNLLVPIDENDTSITVSPQRTDAIGILEQYISMLFKFLSAITAIIAVLILIAAGFMIMFAGGDTAQRDTAKQWAEQSLGGLALLFLGGLILYTINPTFFSFEGQSQVGGVSGNGTSLEQNTDSILNADDISTGM